MNTKSFSLAFMKTDRSQKNKTKEINQPELGKGWRISCILSNTDKTKQLKILKREREKERNSKKKGGKMDGKQIFNHTCKHRLVS